MPRSGGKEVAVGAVISAAAVIVAIALISVGTGQSLFRRQVEYHRALTEHLEKTGRATP